MYTEENVRLGELFVYRRTLDGIYYLLAIQGIHQHYVDVLIEDKPPGGVFVIGDKMRMSYFFLSSDEVRKYKGHIPGDITFGWTQATEASDKPSISMWDTSHPAIAEPECTCDIRQLSSYGCTCKRKEWLDKNSTVNRVDNPKWR